MTDRKSLEEELLRAASIVRSSDDAIVAKTLEGIIVSWNPGAEKMYGYSENEVKGRPITLLLPEGLPDETADILKRIQRGEKMDHYETVRRRKDGRLINVSLSVSPIRDTAGAVIGASTIARDITVQKQAQEALRVAGAYNRSLIDASLDPLVTIGADGKIMDVNAATELVTGYSREELIGQDFSDYFTEPGRARAGYQQVFQEGSVRDYALEIRHRDGHLTPVLYNASVYRDEGGNVIGVFAAARDVTETKRAQAAVQAERKRLFDVLETLPAMICLLTPDYYVTFANRSFREKFGESKGRHCYEYCFGRTGPCEFCESYNVLKTGQPQHWEVSGPDGSVIDVHDFPFTDVDGSPLILEMDIDITERKRAEAELHSTSLYARSLIEASLDPLVTIGADGKIMDVSGATELVTGYSREELIGQDFSDYFTEPERARAGYQQVFREGSVRDYALEIRHRDGHMTPVLYNASVYRDESGNVIGVFAAARDITVQKKAEQERERLIGELREALAKVKTLSGFLPICASCKKIRDDKGYWNQIEVYIRDHSSAEFSHSLCPDCARKLYPEFADKILREEKPREGDERPSGE